MTIAIDSSIKLDLNLIFSHILHFWDHLGQIWSKITQRRSQIENLICLGQNISLQGKHTKNLEFHCHSSKNWFLVLDSSRKLIFEFFVIRFQRRGF